MNTLKQKLRLLYESKIHSLEKMDLKDFAGPLLMSERAKNYDKQRYKLLFIGKESNGWMDGTLDIDFLMNEYEEKKLDKTNFWRFIYDIHNSLNPEYKEEFEFYWTNISKFSKIDGTALDQKDAIKLYENFYVLKDEIEIIKPDAIIVFSYDKHDDWLHWQIDGEIVWNKVDEFTANQLSQLSHPVLPQHTYRTYHPDYLNRNQALRESVLKKIIDKIIKS